MRERHVGVVGAPLRLVAELLVERLDEHLGQRILVFERPPEVRSGIDAFHEFRTRFLREERNLVRDHHLHLRRQTELLGLLHRQHRVAAPVDVDDGVSAGVGDVGEVLAEVLRAERRDLVGHHASSRRS